MELFFLLNLTAFAILSIYTTDFSIKWIRNQQILAVVMVGTVLLSSCFILGHQIFVTISKHKAVVQKLIDLIPMNIMKKKDATGGTQKRTQKQEDTGTKTTHTLVEITGCATPNDQLRELLLSDETLDS